LDTLTGASATGAVAQPNAQTFSRPSGDGQYTTSPNELPLDDTFRDTRVTKSVQIGLSLFIKITRINIGGKHFYRI